MQPKTTDFCFGIRIKDRHRGGVTSRTGTGLIFRCGSSRLYESRENLTLT